MSQFKRYYLNIFVFGTGMVVLVIELTGSRLLAPYFGNGIFVWSNIITVILLALAVGYWAGGWLADRRPNYDWLMWLVIAAGVMVSFTPVLFKVALIPAVEKFTVYNNSVVMLSLCAAILLFFIPTCLLGMVSPFANRLACQDPSTVGRATGRLYAW
jgi:predicted membrane-bound spermidine synthase